MNNKEILYHASDIEFDKFERTGDRLTSMGLGHYLTPSLEKARQYGSVVMAFEVNTKGFLDWNNLPQDDRRIVEESLLKMIPSERVSHFGKAQYKVVPRNKEGLLVFQAMQLETANAYNDSAKARIVTGDDIPEYLKDKDTSQGVIIRWQTAGSLEFASDQQLMALMQEYEPELARALGYKGSRFSDEVVTYNSDLALKIGIVSDLANEGSVKKGSQSLARSRTIALKDYYESGGARELAHSIKKGSERSCLEMANELSKEIRFPPGATLVPLPSRNGKASSNLTICEEIAKQTGVKVNNCLTGDSRSSLYEIKKRGIIPSENYLSFQMAGEPLKGDVFLFDATVDTGTTLVAAEKAIKGDCNIRFLCHSMRDLFKDRNLHFSDEDYLVY